MRKGLRCFAAIGLSAAGLALVGPGTALAGTLDQQQTDGDGGGPFALGTAQSHAQTFTVGVSGGIDQVDLDLRQISTLVPLTVQIRNVVGSAPGTTILAGGSVPSTGDAPLAFVPIHFAPPAPVVAGTQYAIVAYVADLAGAWGWGHSAAANPYTGGGAFTNVGPPPPSASWSPDATDLAFKTYVVPTASTGPTGKRAAALKKCKKKHSKKAKKKCKKKARKLPV
jgi:hypothetical protein